MSWPMTSLRCYRIAMGHRRPTTAAAVVLRALPSFGLRAAGGEQGWGRRRQAGEEQRSGGSPGSPQRSSWRLYRPRYPLEHPRSSRREAPAIDHDHIGAVILGTVTGRKVEG